MKIFDLHCDTILKLAKKGYSFYDNNGHISESGLLKGDYLSQCFAVYIPASVKGKEALDYFKTHRDIFVKTVNNSEVLEFARTADDIKRNINSGKISAVLTAENAEFLDSDLGNISVAKEAGVRILGLIHNGENCLGYPNATQIQLDNLPLKKFGREVIEILNDTDIYADVSHLNYGGFKDAVEIVKKPIIATHSGCRELIDHPRNLYDDQIGDIANSGGIVGVVFFSDFVNGTDKTELDDIIRHIKHLINVGGEDIAALGTDFDGMDCKLFLRGADDMQLFADQLIKTFGFSLAEKICYKNALRLF